MNFVPILYSYYRSSCSWRLRIALDYKKIPYEYRAVNLLKGEHRSDDYLKVNPFGKVPALMISHNDQTIPLVESIAILEYLEEIHPERPLLPTDPCKRAQVRGICEVIVSGIQPLQNLAVLLKIDELNGDKLKWAQTAISDGFKTVEKLLETTSGTFCVGNEITMADVCLIPQVYNAKRYSVSLNSFPLLVAIVERLEKEIAFHTSHPDRQIDAPQE